MTYIVRFQPVNKGTMLWILCLLFVKALPCAGSIFCYGEAASWMVSTQSEEYETVLSFSLREKTVLIFCFHLLLCFPLSENCDLFTSSGLAWLSLRSDSWWDNWKDTCLFPWPMSINSLSIHPQTTSMKMWIYGYILIMAGSFLSIKQILSHMYHYCFVFVAYTYYNLE